MRALIVTSVYPHAQSPTEGLFNEQHTQALRAAGIEVTVLLAKPWLPDGLARALPRYRPLWRLPLRETRYGIEILFARYLHIPRLRTPHWTVASCGRAVLKTLCREGLAEGFDVVQVHSTWPVGMAAPAVAKTLGRPFVVTLHIRDDPRLYRRPAGLALYQRIFESAAALTVVGRPLERFLLELGYQGSIHRIPNGVALEAIRKVLGDTAPNTGPWGRLVSVSSLWPSKGIDCNLRALARLDKTGHEWHSYTVVGEGPERQRLERLAGELGIAKRVVFTGNLPHPQALQQIAQGDIFTLPSWQEAFGVVYLEAMACGKPVVGCRTQGAEDIFEHGRHGLLVELPAGIDKEPLVAGLTEALGKLLADEPFGRQLGDAGKRRAEEFTWARSGRRYAGLYQEALARESGL